MPTQSLSFSFLGRDVSAGKTFSGIGGEAEKASGHVSRFSSTLSGLATGGAILAVAELGKKAIQMADQFEGARARLENITANIGGNFGDISGKVTALDSSMAKFGFTNDQTESSLAMLEAATKSTSKAMTDASLAANIARGRNIGLDQATQLLVKVETGHVSLLGRYGIATKNAAGQTITQTQAMQKLTDLYGGSASRFAGTFAGKQAAATAELKNAASQLGVALIPAVSKLADILANDVIPAVSGLVHWLGENGAVVKPLALGLLAMVAAWKAYTLGVRAAEAITALFGNTAVATSEKLAVEGAAARSAGAANATAGAGGAALGAARAVPLVGLAVMGAGYANSVTAGGNAASLQRLTTYAQTGSKAVAVLRTEYDRLGQALGHTSGMARQSLDAMRGQIKSAIDSTGATQQQTGATRGATTALHSESVALTTLTAAMEAHASAVLSTLGSYDTFRQNLNDLPSVVKQNGTALSGFSDKAIANRQALGAAAQAIFAHIDAMKKQGASAKQVNSSLADMEGRLRRQAAATFGSKQAVDAFLGKLRLLPGQTRQALAGLRADGSAAGGDLGRGLVEGMQAKLGAVTAEAKILADSTVKSMRLAAQVHSPSRLTRDVGHGIGDGLAQGMNDKHGKVSAAAKKLAAVALAAAKDSKVRDQFAALGGHLADGIIHGFGYHAQQLIGKLDGFTQYLLQKVEDRTSAGLAAIHQGMQDKIAKVRADLSTTLGGIDTTLASKLNTIQAGVDLAKQKLLDLRNAAASMAASIAQALGAVNLGSLFGTDAAGNQTVGSVSDMLTSKLSALQTLAADIASLRALGLSGTLLSDIVSLPVDQATAISAQIIAAASGPEGGGYISGLNTTQAGIDTTAAGIGGNVAGANYDTQIAAQTQTLAQVRDAATQARLQASADAQRARQEAREDAQRQIAAIREAGRRQERLLAATIEALANLGSHPTVDEMHRALLRLKNRIGKLGLA